MSSNFTVVSINTGKTIDIFNINGTLHNTINHNEIILLPYNSYIIQLSNPIHTQFTDILDLTSTFLGNFLLFSFIFIMLMLFYAFAKIIKRHGVN